MPHVVWTPKAKGALTRERSDLELMPTTIAGDEAWIDRQWIRERTSERLVTLAWSDLIAANPKRLAACTSVAMMFENIAYSLIERHGPAAAPVLARWVLGIPVPKVFAALSIVRDSADVAYFFAMSVGRVQGESLVRAEEFRPTALAYLREHAALTRAALPKVARDEAANAAKLEADDDDVARSKAAAKWARGPARTIFDQ